MKAWLCDSLLTRSNNALTVLGPAQKALDTFCAPDAFAFETISPAGSCVSENGVCGTIVSHSRFSVISAVILSIQPDVVGPEVACYERT